jgi:hypothetical protein
MFIPVTTGLECASVWLDAITRDAVIEMGLLVVGVAKVWDAASVAREVGKADVYD